MKTLIIIDVQNDFMPGQALEVKEGDMIVPVLNRILPYFDSVVATQDWHPSDHKSFASNHSNKQHFDMIELDEIEQILWPDHCVQGTVGAEFHPELNLNYIEAIFRKGMDSRIDSYSGFYDNGKKKSTGLNGYLREKHAKELYFCGLAADVCVYHTIIDALNENYSCSVIEDAIRSLDIKDYTHKKQELRMKGVSFINSNDIEFIS